MNADRTYRFGPYEVVPRLRQVRHNGVPVEAQPKAFDLLLYLIESRDRVVDKDELLERLWPGLVVSESALTQIVRKARALVGDDGTRQAVIRTVQRRGFHFVAELDGEAPAAAASTIANHGRAAPAAHEDASVAVLPFVDMSPERDQEYFCDGMAEEVINELAKIPGLRVAARTSTFAFKHKADDVREIGRRLNVRTVLEGSVRKSGDRLRVTAQLIDAETGFHLWSERWDRRLEDMFAIQSEIAHLIAAGLRRPRTAGAAVPGQFTADDLCDRGFAYLHRHGQRSQRFAMDLFRQALKVDARSARAWAGLSLSHMVLYRGGDDSHRDEAVNAAARALELDPQSAPAWTAHGAAAVIGGDFAAAERAYRRALELDPMLFETYYYYGHACSENGRHAQAAELYERAAEIKPDDYQALVFAVTAYRTLGQHEQMLSAAARQLAAAERALAADPTDARALSLSAGSLIVLGRADEAKEWSRRARELEPDESYVHYNAACAYAQVGELDEAIAMLEGGTDGGRFCRVSWVEHDEDLAPLRGHPRFQALLAERTARFTRRGGSRRPVTDRSQEDHDKVRA